MLSTKFGYGLPAALAAALALAFLAGDNNFGLGRSFGLDLSQTGFVIDSAIKKPGLNGRANHLLTLYGLIAFSLTLSARCQVFTRHNQLCPVN